MLERTVYQRVSHFIFFKSWGGSMHEEVILISLSLITREAMGWEEEEWKILFLGEKERLTLRTRNSTVAGGGSKSGQEARQQ